MQELKQILGCGVFVRCERAGGQDSRNGESGCKIRSAFWRSHLTFYWAESRYLGVC